jgi:PHD/YefM family antitoxin component YafN of YafNO toxin-antitoxin module
MKALHPEYIIDEQHHKKAVVLPYSEWKMILEELEELEDIRAYDAVKAENEELLLFAQAVDEIKKA